MVGVFARRWVEPVARVLDARGSERAMVVHGSDGLDEITTTGPTFVGHLQEGTLRTFEVCPEDVGLPPARPEALRGGDAATNAAALLAVLAGQPGAYRDVTIFNAAAAFVIADRADDLRGGVALATEIIDDGSALHQLKRLVGVSNAT